MALGAGISELRHGEAGRSGVDRLVAVRVVGLGVVGLGVVGLGVGRYRRESKR